MSSGVIKTLSGGQGTRDRSGTVEVGGRDYPFSGITFTGGKAEPAVGDKVDVSLNGTTVTAIVDPDPKG